MPIEAMCSCGRLALRSALPSLVQTTNAAGLGDGEVGAGHAGVAPSGSTAACAGAGSRPGSARRCSSDRCRSCRRTPRATSSRSLCTAGTTMWLGGSSSSCWMRSPRSVSMTSMPRFSRNGPHVAFVGQHRLALDQRACAACAQDVEHDLVVLGGVARPVHVRAVRGRVALELLEVVGEMGQRVLLDRRGQRRAAPPTPAMPRFRGRASCAGPTAAVSWNRCDPSPR